MPIDLIDITRPKNDGNFPISEDTDHLGGFRVVADLTARDAIPSGRRKEGMLVRVQGVGDFTLSGGITNGDWVVDAGGGSSRTTENFTVTVNSGSGTDPAGLTFLTQAEVDAHGAVATAAQALKALPDGQDYLATISLADGTHSLDTPTFSSFDELGRFNFNAKNLPGFTKSGIRFTSASGLVAVAGTITMPVTSVVNNTITLTSDPSLTTDTMRKKFVRVNGGASDGRIFPCTGNNGVTFTAIRIGSLSCTSIDILEPAAKLTTASTIFRLEMNSHGMAFSPDFEASLYFDAVEIEDTSGTTNQFEIKGDSEVVFENGVLLTNWGLRVGKGASVRLGEVILDGGGIAHDSGIFVAEGGFLRSINSNQTWGFFDYAGQSCISLDTINLGGIGATTILFGGGFDNFAGAAITAKGPASIAQLFDNLEFTNPGPYDLNVEQGAKVYWPSTSFDLSKYTVGTSGAFMLDGVGYSAFTEITDAPDGVFEGYSGAQVGSPASVTDLTSPSLAVGRAKLKQYQEGVAIPAVLAPTGTTQTIDWNTGEFQILDASAATGDVTLTLNNPVEGALYIIKFIQHSSTAVELVWPAAVINDPPVTLTLGESMVIQLRFDGTSYFPPNTSLLHGRKAYSNLQGDPVTANQEWQSPPFDTNTENSAIYCKLQHRDDELDDFIYGIYFEIADQSLTGGSATKTMHFGRGDAHYVALFADPSLNGGLSGGFGYEGAMFADAENSFLASFQGTSGFGNSNPAQQNCIGFNALVHDDATDPTLQGMDAHNFGLFIATNSLGNSFVVRQSEYIPSPGVAQFKLTDHNFRPLWVVFGSGEVHQYGLEADVSNQNQGAPAQRFRNYYWDGADEQIYDCLFQPGITGAPTPVPQLSIAFQEIVDDVPAATEFAAVITPGEWDFSTNDLVGADTFTLSSGTGSGLDCQGKDIEAVGDITLVTGSGTGLDLQGKTIVNAATITMSGGGGNVDLQGGQLTNTAAIVPLASNHVQLAAHRNTVTASTPAGTTQTIDWFSGNDHYIDLGSASGDVTLTLSNPIQGGHYHIKAHNNGSNRNLIWPAAVLWPGGTAPVITTGAGAIDMVYLEYDGTNYLARFEQAFA